MHLVTTGNLTNNPFYGPWMPIYGFGVIIMIFLTRLVFNRIKLNRPLKIVILFLAITIILTILELIGGYLTEFAFHKSFGDYTDLKFNFGKYIALEVSLGWGKSLV